MTTTTPDPTPSKDQLNTLRKTLKKRIHHYYQTIEQLKLTTLWKDSWKQYYSGLHNLGRSRILQSPGELTSLTKVSVNDYGNILRNLHTLITRDPPLMDAKPINPSTEAISEVIPAKILLEFYQDQKYLDKEIAQAKLYELLFGTGYLLVDWEKAPLPLFSHTSHSDPLIEKSHSLETLSAQTPLTQPIQGDLSCSAHSPFDVINSVYGSPHQLNWYIVRKFYDRKELAAFYQNPRLARETVFTSQSTGINLSLAFSDLNYQEQDLIDVFFYYQKPTHAAPKGRKVIFTKNHVLSYEPLPGKHLPIIRIANETLMNTTLGSTIAFDLLEMQKTKDSLISTVISNQSNFGLNSIVVPKAAQLESNRLGNNLNIFEISDSSEAPSVLNLLQSNPEIFKMVDYLEKAMERISGINSVVRGNASPSQSGQALALITSMSLQFVSGYLRTFRETYKQCGERILSLLKHNLPAGRQYRITGKTGKVCQGVLSPSSLYEEYHVSVELVSPLKSTLQGRELMATTLLEKGFIQEPRDFLSILVHGRIEDILTPEAKLKESLKHEGELLISDQPVKVLELQHHPAFIRHDLRILNDHEKLKDQNLVHRVYSVILKRLATWKQVSQEHPDLLEIADIPLYSGKNHSLNEALKNTFSDDSTPTNPHNLDLNDLDALANIRMSQQLDQTPPNPEELSLNVNPAPSEGNQASLEKMKRHPRSQIKGTVASENSQSFADVPLPENHSL